MRDACEGAVMSKMTEKDLIDLNEALWEVIWMPNKADANRFWSQSSW